MPFTVSPWILALPLVGGIVARVVADRCDVRRGLDRAVATVQEDPLGFVEYGHAGLFEEGHWDSIEACCRPMVKRLGLSDEHIAFISKAVPAWIKEEGRLAMLRAVVAGEPLRFKVKPAGAWDCLERDGVFTVHAPIER